VPGGREVPWTRSRRRGRARGELVFEGKAESRSAKGKRQDRLAAGHGSRRNSFSSFFLARLLALGFCFDAPLCAQRAILILSIWSRRRCSEVERVAKEATRKKKQKEKSAEPYRC
jgi:hypothetical protein